jgi:transcriptional regulator with XRE-family HTH domain
MRRASDLIDLAKASKDAGSDYKVARHIDVTPQRLSDYRRERRFPSKKHIIALCELALEDPAFWVFQLEARKAKTARDAALYERVAANYA